MAPDFRSTNFLLEHARTTFAFYYPGCLDYRNGGYFQFFLDNGKVYDPTTRHLVSSARFVFQFAVAARFLAQDEGEKKRLVEGVRHGLAALRNHHYRSVNGPSYAWVVKVDDSGVEVADSTNHCYGLAFVLLAYAHALMAGVEEARGGIDEVFGIMEERFWNNTKGLYSDEASGDWTTLSDYRGQNANMVSGLYHQAPSWSPYLLSLTVCISPLVLWLPSFPPISTHVRRCWHAMKLLVVRIHASLPELCRWRRVSLPFLVGIQREVRISGSTTTKIGALT